MKRLKCFLLLAASGSAIALLVYPAALSAADGKPTKVAVTDEQQSFQLPGGARVQLRARRDARVEQPVHHDVPGRRERRRPGDGRRRSEGAADERRHGKSIVVNVSGPSTQIVHPDGSSDLTLEGSVIVLYNARFNPRGPATYIYTGRTVFSVSDDGILTLVSTTDKQPFDVCAALS